MSNVDQFNAAVKTFTTNFMPMAMVRAQKKIVFDLLGSIVQKTPVDTGRARGNWQLTINTMPSGEVTTSTAPSPQSPATAAEMQASVVTGHPPYQIVYITNNVTYITYLEEGHSSQAKQGMVEVTLAEMITHMDTETL